MNRCFLLSAVLLSFASFAFAQDSLGDAARQARAQKAAHPHAKIVADDELAPLKARTPFPELNLRGLDNTGDICRSIADYRKSHKREEFEASLHTWYEDYDQMIRLYLKQQVLLQERLSDQYTRPEPSYSGEYDKYWEEMRVRQRADELDRRREYTDQIVIARVQSGLQRIKSYLMSNGTNFDWFKVRQTAADYY